MLSIGSPTLSSQKPPSEHGRKVKMGSEIRGPGTRTESASKIQKFSYIGVGFICEIVMHIVLFKYESEKNHDENLFFSSSLKLLKFKLLNSSVLLLIAVSLSSLLPTPAQKAKNLKILNGKDIYSYFFLSNLLFNSLVYQGVISSLSFEPKVHEACLLKDNIVMISLYMFDFFLDVFGYLQEGAAYDALPQTNKMLSGFRIAFLLSNLGEIAFFLLYGAFKDWLLIIMLIAANTSLIFFSQIFFNLFKKSLAKPSMNIPILSLNNSSEEKLISSIKNIIHSNVERVTKGPGDIITKLSKLKSLIKSSKSETELANIIQRKSSLTPADLQNKTKASEEDEKAKFDDLGELDSDEIDEILKRVAETETDCKAQSDERDYLEAKKTFKNEYSDFEKPQKEFDLSTNQLNRVIDSTDLHFDWNLDVFNSAENGNNAPILVLVGMDLFQKFKAKDVLSISNQIIENFLQGLNDIYKGVYYHNAFHAADVTNTISCFFSEGWIRHFSDLECICTMIAGLGHDLGHPGVNNPHLISAKSDLAILYNDQSVLENMHCALLFKLLKEEKNNILQSIDLITFRSLRNQIINMILNTDLQKHSHILAEWDQLTSGDIISYESQKFKEISQSIAIKCADLGHGAKKIELHKKWSRLLLEEFYLQGEMEKQLNMAISPLCNRSDKAYAKAQEGFLKNIISPLFEKWLIIFDSKEFKDKIRGHLKENIEYWSSHSSQTTDENLLFTQTDFFWKKFNKNQEETK